MVFPRINIVISHVLLYQYVLLLAGITGYITASPRFTHPRANQ